MWNFAGPRRFHVLVDVASCLLNLDNDAILLPYSKCDGVNGSSSFIFLDTNVIGRSFRMASTSAMSV